MGLTVETVRFLEYGQKAPKNSCYEGTVMTESVFGHSGYLEYTGRSEAIEDNTRGELVRDSSGFLGYTSRAGAEKGVTMTSLGPLTREKRGEFRKEGAKYFAKKGDLIWDLVISFESYEEAKRYNLNHQEDYAAVISAILPQFFSYAHFRNDNMFWWMDYHTNTAHPHMHVCFMEKEKTRSRGKFTQRELKELKRLVMKEIFARKNLEAVIGKDYKEAFRIKDQEAAQLLEAVKKIDLSAAKSVDDLAKILPKSGRFQYNSANMKPYREAIDRVTDSFLNNVEIKEDYMKYLDLLEVFDRVMNEGSGAKIGTLKDAELKNLHVLIGNHILREIKEMRSSKQRVTIGKEEYRQDSEELEERDWKKSGMVWREYRQLLKEKKVALALKDPVERETKLKEVYEELEGLLRGNGKEKELSDMQKARICHQLGWMEFYGEGTVKDPNRAQQDILSAVIHGSSHSWALKAKIDFKLGYNAAGMTALRKGAEQGSSFCMFLIGRELNSGKRCEKNRVEGFAWMERSAAAGCIAAKQYLRSHDFNGYRRAINRGITRFARRGMRIRLQEIRSEIAEFLRSSNHIHTGNGNLDEEIEQYLNR